MLHPKDVTALPPGIGAPSDLPGEWIICRVRGGYERKLIVMLTAATIARDLEFGNAEAPGIGYCLPMERVQRRADNQNRGTYARLVFPCYLFFACRHEDDYYELVARKREGILQLIRVADQKQFVREMSGFHIAAENQMLKLGRASGIRVGIQCEVVRGALRGHKGWIESIEGDEKEVWIGLTILGQSVPTKISIEDVEPVN